jgi:hypothetical protein
LHHETIPKPETAKRQSDFLFLTAFLLSTDFQIAANFKTPQRRRGRKEQRK